MKKLGIYLSCGLLLTSLQTAYVVNANSTDSIKVTISSKEAKYQEYQNVIKKLNDAGFTNIKTNEIKDLPLGVFTKEGDIENGDVEEVKIDGKTKFNSSDKFRKDSLITISYHSFASNEADENLISLPFSSKEISKQNYKDIVKKLKKAGFTNIKTEKIDDLVFGWLKKDGTIDQVKVDGITDFKKNEKINKDTEIIVSYHTFPEQTIEEKSPVSNVENSSAVASTEKNIQNSSSSTQEVITTENNAEFASILQTDEEGKIKEFTKKYSGKVVEFDGYIADIQRLTNTKYNADVLIYAGDTGALTGPAFQLHRVSLTNLSKQGVTGINQNVHIKATIVPRDNYLFGLDPIEVKPR
jgi:hypothetical protein